MIEPLNNESLERYKIRLCNNKEELKLSWKQISRLVKTHFGENVSGDYIRHEHYSRKKFEIIEEENVGKRILVVSDHHYPFNLPVEVLKGYEDKVDVLVFNGDEQDCQSISKFSKKYRIPFMDELIGTRQMIIDTINFIKPKEVKLNYGNHNARFINYLSSKLDTDMLSLMPKTNLDLIIDTGFWKYDHEKGVKVFYEPLKDLFGKIGIKVEFSDSWWCKVGKTIFAHPSAYKSGILGTTEKSYLYYLQHGEDFDTVVLAHTHQIGFTKYGKHYLFEGGSLCKEQEYATSGRLNKPQNTGFVYIIQDHDGKLIYDKCKLVIVE